MLARVGWHLKSGTEQARLAHRRPDPLQTGADGRHLVRIDRDVLLQPDGAGDVPRMHDQIGAVEVGERRNEGRRAEVAVERVVRSVGVKSIWARRCS